MPNLATTIQQLEITAGGAGSGRHKTAQDFRKDMEKAKLSKRPKEVEDKPVNKETHKLLTGNKWGFGGNTDGHSLYYPKKGQANYSLKVHPNGTYKAVK